jgi:transposase
MAMTRLAAAVKGLSLRSYDAFLLLPTTRKPAENLTARLRSGSFDQIDSSPYSAGQASHPFTISAAGDVSASRCMGRSRGGLTTKIHAVADANGNPFTLKLTEGQAHDGRSAQDMLDSVGPGQTLLADRAYDSDALREALAKRRAKANIKPMPNRVNIPKFSKKLYRKRNLVERFFNKLKHFRESIR